MLTRTFTPKTAEVHHEWYVVDAAGQTVGRVATEVCNLLRGKNKPTYSPHMDVGDYVVIINASQVLLTGGKPGKKIYYHHTGHPQGFRQINFIDQMKKHPTRPLYDAIKGMLPHNRLGRAMIGKLKVYPGASHPHTAQSPKPYQFVYIEKHEE